MKFVAEVNVMPKKELLDPQGKAVKLGLKHLHIEGVKDVRIGKHIVLTFEAETPEQAREIVDTACQKLLANVIMEDYSFEIKELQEALKK
ncbi:MAG: phosphoribosylformylglycinamidine synthase subunit PurS [Thermonema sp.]|uniref:phosphoribosylformylglycinamidine synthase subunit PurS n=1 Tax=Thermonema sp. TaxID=2231181 RepID=UPI0021DE3BE5|nr:phosphoribosylformylglycinamidine synthase subunit PurS [Thermonema sp.]GIV39580.1 MAG: phosphoribosylformylglycinamidine synthase subunit PurS [Thermonema sp.]